MSISQGFRIGFNPLRRGLKSTHKNLSQTHQHPQVVEENLSTEILHHHMASLFQKELLPTIHINRFWVIPKHHQAYKWHLIVYPASHSVNDEISKTLCCLSYITMMMLFKIFIELVPNIHTSWKTNIRNTFCILPVHPAEWQLMSMEWNKEVYIDTCLPFGLWSAPIAEQWRVTLSPFYLNDFSHHGICFPTTCQQNLTTFQHVCLELYRNSLNNRKDWRSLNLPHIPGHSPGIS